MTMKIVIATPLYPPQIGGPAQYAFFLNKELAARNHAVKVVSFHTVLFYPSVIRHIMYFFLLLPQIVWADRVIALDASSSGVLAVFISTVFKKKCIVRLGGDFLWEAYIERTHAEISLPDFYERALILSAKERFIKRATKFALNNSIIVVNTDWLKNILSKGYAINKDMYCIENVFGSVRPCPITTSKHFFSPSRELFLKNKTRLREVFDRYDLGATVHTGKMSQESIREEIKHAYAIAVPSFSEVNPHLVLEGLSAGKPFLLTKYTGLPERFKPFGIFVDPFDSESIAQGVRRLCDDAYYRRVCFEIEKLQYVHTWQEVAEEFEKIMV